MAHFWHRASSDWGFLGKHHAKVKEGGIQATCAAGENSVKSPISLETGKEDFQLI